MTDLSILEAKFAAVDGATFTEVPIDGEIAAVVVAKTHPSGVKMSLPVPTPIDEYAAEVARQVWDEAWLSGPPAAAVQ